MFLLADSVAAELRDRWATRVRMVSPAEWQARPLRWAGTLFVPQSVQVTGRFARVALAWDGRLAQRAGFPPRGFTGSAIFFLLRTPAGWLVVDRQAGMT